MDIDATKWAYEADLPPCVKGSVHAVLAALTYSLNNRTRQCNPSVERLVKITRIKETTVKHALKILKREGLISYTSGKRLKKSNSYIIHYSIIPKKKKATAASDAMSADTIASDAMSADTTRKTDVGSNSNPNGTFIGSDSNPTTVQNVTTNKYTEYALQQTRDSSSSINGGDDEVEVRSSTTTALSPQKKKTRPNKPCNYDFAKEVVRDWYRSNDWDPDEKRSSASIEALSRILTFLPDPNLDDVKRLYDLITETDESRIQDCWDIAEETGLNCMAEYENGRRINNFRNYLFTAIENEINYEDDEE